MIKVFLTALMFYTRIPVPVNIDYSPERLNKSTRFFPMIGWVVGSIVAGLYWSALFILPQSISIIISMAGGILVTGAFHEDGFADVCDGFGGGYTKEDRLRIMKDSRIGTYGSIGLIMILLSKYLLLQELSSYNLVIILIVAHSFSRFIPVMVIYWGEYSRDDLTSKVKPIGKKISLYGFIFSFVTSLLPILLFKNYLLFSIMIPPIILGLFFKKYFKKRVGGYTGDCLGTIQQVCEISIYLTIYILLSLNI